MSEQPASLNNPDTAPEMPPRKVRWGRIGCVTLLVAVISAPFVLMFLIFASIVDGEEFSPDTFETRRFQYYRLPVIGTVLTKRSIEDSSSVLHQTLLSDGFVTPPATKTNRWDLIRENWTSGNSPDFDASILDSYLAIRSDGSSQYWHNWNDQNPERAAVLWPAIADLARANQYVLMPDLFRLSRELPKAKSVATDPFQADLQKLASQLLRDQARRFRESGDSAVATELENLAKTIGTTKAAVTTPTVKSAEKLSPEDAGNPGESADQ